ncbi:hypothetical protein BDZ91DRAFT_852795 [Kalaharituber pfeilii]|nr:hypothetical protein BDZ91DRAFT_852795 [Kalaharituber pfeilii]
MYRIIKRLGIPDSQIIMMLSDDVACSPWNAFPDTVYNNADRAFALYGDNIEVDYRGYVENFIRLLTDRVASFTPRNAFQQMWEKKRYHEMLFKIDTCLANTMYSKMYSPNIIATGDSDVEVAVIDRYTYYNLEFPEKTSNQTPRIPGKIYLIPMTIIKSAPGIRTDFVERKLDEVLINDFFGDVQNVEVDGDGTRMHEDLVALSRLAANLTAQYGPDAEWTAMDEKMTKGASSSTFVHKKIRMMRVEEKNSWGRAVIGGGALMACAIAWAASSDRLRPITNSFTHASSPPIKGIPDVVDLLLTFGGAPDRRQRSRDARRRCTKAIIGAEITSSRKAELSSKKQTQDDAEEEQEREEEEEAEQH